MTSSRATLLFFAGIIPLAFGGAYVLTYVVHSTSKWSVGILVLVAFSWGYWTVGLAKKG